MEIAYTHSPSGSAHGSRMAVMAPKSGDTAGRASAA